MYWPTQVGAVSSQAVAVRRSPRKHRQIQAHFSNPVAFALSIRFAQPSRARPSQRGELRPTVDVKVVALDPRVRQLPAPWPSHLRCRQRSAQPWGHAAESPNRRHKSREWPSQQHCRKHQSRQAVFLVRESARNRHLQWRSCVDTPPQ